MHIEFKKISLHNFMSFGDAEVTFNSDGFIRVSGVNENPVDNAVSNGSGKSSLWEALVWAITGDTIRGTKQIVNMYGDDGCFVDIEFYIDTTSYRIIRSKEHKVRKTNLQILVNNEDVSGKGIRDSQQILQQYLPNLTASLLGSVIILGQGLPQKFTNNTPSGRKEVLENLSNSDFMIDDLKKRVASRKLELTQDQRSYEDKILELNTQKNFLLSQIAQSESILTTLDSEKLNKDLNDLNISKNLIEQQISELTPQFKLTSEELLKVKEEDLALIAKQTNELNSEKINYDTTVNPILSELNSLKAELNVYNTELNRLKNIKDVCPTCNQKIYGVHKPDTSDIEQKIQLTKVNIDKLNSTLSEYKLDYEYIIKSIQDKYREEKSLLIHKSNELSSNNSALKTQINTLEKNLSDVLSQLSETTKQLTQLNTNIEFNQKIIIDNNEKIKVIDNNLMYNNMQKDLTQSHLDIISKFDTALKRDFRGYLLSTVIDYIDSKAKQYCKVIFDTTNISFCLNGNNIDISYMNKAYENLSGGEKQKIDLIIQFSIRDMLSNQLNFTSNILVLDEVFDGLDTIGCNRVIDVISNLSDVKNVFIVTHRRDLSIPTDKELIVVKSTAGISEIRQ